MCCGRLAGNAGPKKSPKASGRQGEGSREGEGKGGQGEGERERSKDYCIDSNPILHSDKDHQMPFVGGPNTHNKSKMADGRHLGKIEKSPYLGCGLTDFDQIWHGDAVRPP